VIATRARRRFRADYFLPFFVVFFEEDFLVVDFLEPFLAAMALGTSFLMGNVKLEEFLVNDFLLACHFFSALSRGAISRARRCSRAPRATL
jgi:hypothetical protein